MKSRMLADVDATRALGRALGRAAGPGCVAALVGDLGAGKTSLAQGVGEGLGVVQDVVSPTFGLVHELIGGRLPLIHADLYRIEDPSEVEELGLEERLEEDVVGLVEWPGRAPEVLPLDHLRVELFHHGAARRVEVNATGPRSRAWWRAAQDD